MAQKYILGHRAQTRTIAIRYTVLVGILLLILSVLQVSLFSRFRLLGAVPDLMICAVLCIAYFNGKFVGAITGIAAGFLIEAIGSGGVMILAVCYLFCGYLVGHYARTAIPRRYSVYLIYLAVILLYRAAITVFYACISYADINLPLILLQSVLPELLVTAIAGCIMYFPMLLFCKFLDKK